MIRIDGKEYQFDGEYVMNYRGADKVLLANLVRFNPYLEIEQI